MAERCAMEVFPYLPFVPDKKTVMRRLGSQKASLPAELSDNIDALLRQAESAFTVRAKAAIFPLEHLDSAHVSIAGAVVESAMLARLLEKSSAAYVMGASIPAWDVEKISEAMLAGEGLKAIVFDAYASEYVDGALDVLIARKNEALRRTRQKLTKHRFSPGYGDLDIAYQKVFFDLLDMRTLDVTINENYLLSPEKSVIAIAGVE
ncbi:MAG: hypothetical protein GXW96_05070 [Christensenellaceae bacterium]|nr:hypothetical protein [Christensenellaceae bacterium]